MRLFRTLAALALAGAMALTAAPADASPPAVPAAPHSGPSALGPYISPWGSAHVRVSDTTRQWLDRNGIKLGAIAPFTLDEDGYGYELPIGSTAGDHLDAKGRIYYPGGVTLTQESTGTKAELQATWIRVMPQPGYAAGIRLNGQQISPETLIAYTTPAEVLASGRPTLKGFKLDRVPFHVTEDTADLTRFWFGDPLPADSLFGTLTPRFDYVP
ncbi:hypothetical protein ADL22_09180 [Streptomyces sp. NRRL F-4489]|nr:hypothetical protein [Streptomyces sp. NRRL F-4489]KUL48747.1 hypothetical protein ADL22_09180 [Streptomyces sp. NRRL F-4489]